MEGKAPMRGGVVVATDRRPPAARILGAMLGALLAGLLATSPVAGAPTAETLTLLQGDHTWTGDGVFSDGGTWVTSRPVFGGLPSPVAFAGNLFITLTGAQGTIDLRLFVEFNNVQERDLCTILGGTGAYDHLAGQGTWTQVGRGAGAVLTCTAATNAS